MRNYEAKDVKRSIRRFEDAAKDILASGYNTYKARIIRFTEITKNDQVINSIVGPLYDIKVNFDQIHYKSPGGEWVEEIRLPTDINIQLAYVVQIFDSVSLGKISLDSLTFDIYVNKNIWSNINSWLHEIVEPCLRELLYRLNDLIEDEVEGKEEITSSSLQIFNYGSITASQGSNIAMGKDIQQTVTYKNITNEIMERVRNEKTVSEDKLEEVEQITNEIQEEINKPDPSQSKLKQFAGKLYEIGQSGLLKVTNTVIQDPRWGQAVADTFMNNF
ncbi:hypothetical protein [Bacillus sp. UMB0893]|uniref:hypothetical protein n=1 Tax=Bacillus sp. UMB0893 TaxID=2066053 RepID=UPI000C77F0BC|nr:hypothetical protein [Bacillus sp. UMB0893]PLR69109.1 hypothetical protein CYJ36_01215 [Bacillus sp. UMB0893]